MRPDEPLTAVVARRFGISIHARSLDRAVARRTKTAPVDHGAAASGPDTEQVCRQYKVVRHDAATQAAFSRRGCGMALLMNRGMPAWLDAMSTISLPPAKSWSPAGNGDLELATPIRSELARVLASLVLRCVSEGASP